MTARMLSNLESVGDMIGSLKGIADGLDESEYTAGLIRQAHGEASNLFNITAAATAGAGHLEHVFEYAGQGVNISPLPSARLWTHTIQGRGGKQDIGFLFRPAVQPNPQPTTASTGVASKYLARLSKRKHVFWNKALVMETGRTVTIRPKHGNFVFVPFYGHPSRANYNASKYTTDRGYMMHRGPIHLQPGGKHVGKFTAFWMSWWGGEGANFMEQRMRATVSADIERAEREVTARAAAQSAMKPPHRVNLVGAAAKANAAMKKKFGAITRAAARKRTI